MPRLVLGACVLLAGLGSALFPPVAAAAATFQVTSTEDRVDDNIGDGVCHGQGLPAGVCTLRAAVQEANKNAGADTIQLNPGTVVKPTVYALTGAAGEDAAATGDLDVTGALTILGASGVRAVAAGRPIVDAGKRDRAFDVMSGASLRLTGVVVRNGSVVPSGNAATTANSGGGIRASGELVLSDDVITGNAAALGGGVTSRKSLVASYTTFSSNTATFGDGAGIDSYGTLSLEHVVVSGNTASGYQSVGGVRSLGTATISDSTFDRNTGSAIGILSGSTMTLTRSTLAQNAASGPSGVGGGVFIHAGNLTVTNSTIAGNSAATLGGGIYLNSGQATLVNDTFTGNGAPQGGNVYGRATAVNTIFGRPSSGGSCVAVTSKGHNLEETQCAVGKAPGDLIGLDPMLAPLADNGGSARTEALLPGSPAIDAGDASSCPATDERGVKRPAGDGCDIGAYEFAVVADLAVTLAATPAQLQIGQPLTYTVTVLNKGPNPATGTTLTDALPAGVTVQSVKPSVGSCTSGVAVECSLGALADQARATVTIVVVPTAAGTLRDTVSVKALQVDPDKSSNSAQADTTVAAPQVASPPQASGGSSGVTAKLVSAHGKRVRGRVRVQLVLLLAQPMRTKLAILYRGRVLAATKRIALGTGRHPLALTARRKTPAGRYVVRVTLVDTRGRSSTLTVKMQLR